MNGDIAYPGIGGAVFAMIGIWSVVGIGIYVWYLWALSRLFPYLGMPKAHGWIPIWNQWRLIERGGLPGWMVLLGIIPGLAVVVLVVSIIAIHRINSEHGEGAGMTVLGAFIPPLWATLLGSRLRDRGHAAGPDAQGGQSPFAGRGLVEYGPNGQVYPLLHTNGGRVPAPPQAPGQPQPPAAPGFAMPQVQGAAPAPAMPPAPPAPPAPAMSAAPPAAQQPSAPAAPPADKQWSLGKTVDSNFERLANEENPALDRLFGSNENARPFSWPEPQPHAQVPPAPAAPAPQAPQPAPTFMPPAPPAQPSAQQPPVQPAAPPAPPATPAAQAPAPQATAAAPAAPPAPVAAPAPQAPAPAPTYAPPVQKPQDAPAASPHLDDDTRVHDAPSDDELDRTVVVSRKAAWVLELPDGRVLDLVGDDIVIGRKPTAIGDSDVLVVPDPTRTLSKSHARLRRTGDEWTIEDLNSTNGVFVFDEAGVQTEVSPGSESAASEQLIIGTLEVRLRPAG